MKSFNTFLNIHLDKYFIRTAGIIEVYKWKFYKWNLQQGMMLLIREISLKQIRDDCVVKLMMYIKWSTICHVPELVSSDFTCVYVIYFIILFYNASVKGDWNRNVHQSECFPMVFTIWKMSMKVILVSLITNI